MSRKLASIQVISDLQPVPNSNNLLVATVLGWKVVVSKNENFKIGDRVVYFEIDSCLPTGVPEYEFLRKTSYRNSPILGEVFRLKTIKLRGQISQGLILPIEVCFKDCMPLPGMDFEVGEDVTDLLNIKKWEVPEVAGLGGSTKGQRPGWIEKSDETRIQSDPELLEAFRNIEYYITTKYDGSSHFIAIDDENKFHFGSHNLELMPTPDKEGSFSKWLTDRNIPEKLLSVKNYFNATRFYVIGEWCGAGIQKNKLSLQKPCWYPFTANADGRRLTLAELDKVCEMLEINHVEVEEIGFDLPAKYPTIDDLLARASENRKHVYPGQPEGIVIRPTMSYYTRKVSTPEGIKEYPNQLLSMKVINNKYLLNDKE